MKPVNSILSKYPLREIIVFASYVILYAVIWFIMGHMLKASTANLTVNIQILRIILAVTFVSGVILMSMFWRPVIVLSLIIISVPLEIYADIFNTFTVSTTELFLFMIGISWIIHFIRERKLKLPEFAISAGWIVFIMMMFLSLINANSRIMGLKQIVKWVEVLMVFLFAVNYLKNAKGMLFIVNVILFMGILISFIGIVQAVKFKFDYLEITGTLGQHNPYAGYIGLIVPFSLIFVFRSNTLLRYIKYLLVFVILITALLLSFSRGALMGFFIAFVIAMLFYKNKRIKNVLILMMILVINFGLVYFKISGNAQNNVFNRFMKINSDISTQSRVLYLKMGLKMIKEHPLIGNGIGNYMFYLPKYYSGPDQSLKCHLHNLYLQIAVEFGIVGLGGFIWLIFACLRKLINKIKQMENSVEYSIAFGCLCSITAFLAHNLVDVLFVHSIGLLFGIILAMALNISDNIIKADKQLI